MGDRANVYLRIPKKHTTKAHQADTNFIGLFLYTHCDGSIWPEVCRKAIESGEVRWHSVDYFNRVLIGQMFKEYSGGTNGGGISPYITDNEYDILCVDVLGNEVGWVKPENLDSIGKKSTWEGVKTFREFVDASPAEYPKEEPAFIPVKKKRPQRRTAPVDANAPFYSNETQKLRGAWPKDMSPEEIKSANRWAGK